MLILVDQRLPENARNRLRDVGEVLEFATRGITYESISGHPDIFFCPTPGGLVVAPNTPEEYLGIFREKGIFFISGISAVGSNYPESARYNVVSTSRYLIHNPAITDAAILSLNPGSQHIAVNQGYTRCNLLAIDGNQFITSDRGIEKKLRGAGPEVLYVSPEGILLEGFKNGFFGGCCGVWDQQLFVAGKLDYLKDGKAVRAFAESAGMTVIELYEGPLYDGGGIFFLE